MNIATTQSNLPTLPNRGAEGVEEIKPKSTSSEAEKAEKEKRFANFKSLVCYRLERLGSGEDRKVSDENTSRKMEIIKSLELEDLITFKKYISGYCRYKKQQNKEWEFKDLDLETTKKVIKGGLFETLVQKEFEEDMQSIKNEDRNISDSLLYFLRFPPPEIVKISKEKHHLDISRMRVPDAIRVVQSGDDDLIRIEGVFEATTAKLDRRKYYQLRDFDEDLEKLTRVLNILNKVEPEHLRKHGFESLVGKKFESGVSDTTVIVPSSDGDITSLISPTFKKYKPELATDLERFFDPDEMGDQVIRLKYSVFTNEDIKQIFDPFATLMFLD